MKTKPFHSASPGPYAVFLIVASLLLGTGTDALAQSSSELRITEDLYQRGERFDRFNANSVRECARKCDQDRNCAGFNYRTRDGRCDLLEKAGEGERNDDYVSGAKSRGRPPQDGGGHDTYRMEETDNERREGRRIHLFNTRHVDECSQACFDDRSCAAFRYRKSDGQCVLMDRAGDTERNRDFVSGVKARADQPRPPGDVNWDYRRHRSCPNGYVNCDAYGDCERRGTPRDCRSDQHRDLLWDYDTNQPCPPGFVNCDASSHCGTRGTPRDCQRYDNHRTGDIYWDYDTNQPCPRGLVNCDSFGDCGKRGDATSCR